MKFPLLSNWLVRWAVVVILAAILYGGARLGQSMAISPGNVTAVWPPAGMALAALLLLGYQVWPGIWLGSFLGNIWAVFDNTNAASVVISIAVASSIAVGATLETLALVFLLRRLVETDNPFGRVEDVFKFVALAIPLSCTASATIGTIALCLSRNIPWADFGATWCIWWLGDAIGVLVMTPALVSWSRPILDCKLWILDWELLKKEKNSQIYEQIVNIISKIPNIKLAEVILLLVLLSSVGKIAFGGGYGVEYMLLPLLVWAAFRCGEIGAATSILIASGLAIWGTSQGFGSFVGESLSESLLLLQSFIGVVAVMTMVLAAMVAEQSKAKAALNQTINELEIRIGERTSLLRQTNEILRREIVERQRTEKELRSSNQQIVNILENIPDAFIALDNEWRFTYINQRAEQHFRRTSCRGASLTRSELLGKYVWKEFPESVGTTFYNEYRQALSQQVSRTIEEYYPPIDIWLEQRVFPAGDGLYIFSQDITSRVKSQQAVRESQERFRAIFEQAAVGIALVATDGHFIRVNQRFCDMLAYEEEELLALSFQSITHPDHLAADLEYIRACVAGRISTYSIEKRYIRKDGSSIWGNLTVSVVRESTGDMKYAIGVVEEIGDRKALERELALREQLLNSFITAAPVGITIINDQLLYLQVNEAIAEINGVSVADHLGKTVGEVIPQLAPVLEPIYRSILTTGESILNVEVSGETPLMPGVLRHWLASYFPIPNAEALPAAIGVVLVEITDSKSAEEALRLSEARERAKAIQLEITLRNLQQTQSQLIQTEKMSSLGQLVAGIAHEINNPISFIYGNLIHAGEYIQELLRLVRLYQRYYPQPEMAIADRAETIELDFVMEDLPKLLDSMKVGAERIRSIVLSLRNFSRLDEADMKPVDIHSGIESTLLILQNRLHSVVETWNAPEHPGIQVIKEFGILPEVTCYPGQLNQVFVNILTNAIDALSEKSSQKVIGNREDSVNYLLPITHYPIPTIRISTEVVKGNSVTISIEDNGSGITEDVKKHLFEPFFTTKPVGKGTGLGLAISYQIVVEKHCGQLTCFSAPGQGTKFLIEIPIRQQYKN